MRRATSFGAAPAHAIEPDSPLVAKARRAAEMTNEAAPEFGCYDQTNPETCQQVRTARGDGGIYVTQTYSSGLVIPCFEASRGYRVCVHIEGPLGDHYWVFAPKDDTRCNQWGGPLTAEFLACEAALPPKP